MKFLKRIIFRVIVAILVCVILSKLKLLGIINVSALSTYTGDASDFCVYLPVNGTCDANLTNSILWNRPFKTYRYYGTLNIQTISFLINFGSNTINKPMYITGAFYTSSTNIGDAPNSLRAYVDTQTSAPFACDIVPMTNDYDAGQGYIATIKCDNVISTNGNFRIFINGPFANYDGAYGLSRFNAFYDDDLLIAQRASNDHLTQLRNSINQTNTKLEDIKNILNQQTQQQQQTNNKLQEQNDLLKNEEGVSNSDIESVLDSQDESNSPITDLVSMPLTLLNKINTGFSSSCSPFSLGTLYGESLVLPCINLSSRLGVLWGIIDILFSIFMAYNIGMMCIRIYNNLTTLKDDSNSVYGGGGS